nr:MAG TPA: hypothetical protein [Caudoviricetes sp.]
MNNIIMCWVLGILWVIDAIIKTDWSIYFH